GARPVAPEAFINPKHQHVRQHNHDTQINQELQNRRSPDVARFKRHVVVNRAPVHRVTVLMMLSAHFAPWPPQVLDRPTATVAVVSNSSQTSPPKGRPALRARQCRASSASDSA